MADQSPLFDNTDLTRPPSAKTASDVRAVLLDELLLAVWEWLHAARAATTAAAAPPAWRRRGQTDQARRNASQARQELIDTYSRVVVEVARLDGNA